MLFQGLKEESERIHMGNAMTLLQFLKTFLEYKYI